MARRIEKGNVVGFVLVGVLLVGLLAGGVWVVRNSLAGVQSEESQGTTVVKNGSDGDSTNGESTDKSAGENNSTSDKELKDALAKQAAESKNSQDKSQNGTGPNQGSVSTSDEAHLPETGPTDTLVSLLGAGLLTATSMAYVRSRSLA